MPWEGHGTDNIARACYARGKYKPFLKNEANTRLKKFEVQVFFPLLTWYFFMYM